MPITPDQYDYITYDHEFLTYDDPIFALIDPGPDLYGEDQIVTRLVYWMGGAGSSTPPPVRRQETFVDIFIEAKLVAVGDEIVDVSAPPTEVFYRGVQDDSARVESIPLLGLQEVPDLNVGNDLDVDVTPLPDPITGQIILSCTPITKSLDDSIIILQAEALQEANDDITIESAVEDEGETW